MSRVATAFRLGVREYRRTPVLVALLAVLPAYAVGVFGYVVPDDPVSFTVGGEAVQAGLPAVVSLLLTPMTAGLFAGIAGLFLMGSATDADARLVVAGYRPHEVVLARLGLLAAVSVLVSLVATGVAALTAVPEHPAWFLLATVLTALVYAAVGVLLALLVSRLAGVYVVMFGSLVDGFLLQNPLATDAPAVAALGPSHHPVALAMEAAFGSSVSLAPLAWSLVVLAVVAAAAVAAFYRATGA